MSRRDPDLGGVSARLVVKGSRRMTGLFSRDSSLPIPEETKPRSLTFQERS
jgi:hypothetical protein